MDVELRSVASGSAEACRWFNAVWSDWLGDGWHAISASDYDEWHQAWWSHRRWQQWVITDDGTDVGTAWIQHGRRADAAGRADIVVYVEARRRRNGVAYAAFQLVAAATAPEGRTMLFSSSPTGSPAHLASEAHGAPRTGAIRLSRLTLDSALDDLLLAIARPIADGYTLVAWDDRCPDVFLESYVAARDAMNDSPNINGMRRRESAGDVRLAEHEAPVHRTMWTVAAVDESGAVAAYTDLLFGGTLDRARQGDTVVVSAHRGHGLGMAVKRQNLARLRAELPRCGTIETWNAVDNHHMLAINEALGFRQLADFEIYRLA